MRIIIEIFLPKNPSRTMKTADNRLTERIMTCPTLLYDALRLNQAFLPLQSTSICTLQLLRELRFGHAFTWRKNEVLEFEPADYIPGKALKVILLDQLETLLNDEDSFVHKPLKWRADNIVPASGIKRLVFHLMKRDADRHFYLKWLSKLHALGVKQKIFDESYRYTEVKPKSPSKSPVNLDNSDGFHNVMVGRVTVEDFRRRKTLGLSKVERLEY